ncbi:hypothetical protein LUZ61_013352 [Rhynchospora tenuis]|uniref:F-box domain-containing protein n=1 Tax=Rhynchospora tenuis TaxID=198213 RepID=A0AAD5Z0P4_9POAL|nr:hypothetical protein LUZ61_013352 [Rhynchospora tenuis]
MEETTDWISSLSDDVLTTILSFVTTKEAVQTSILSKRWINTWASVPVLKFEYDNYLVDGDTGEDLKFEQFVDGVLQNRTAHLDTVMYDCYFDGTFWEPSTEWLDRVVLLKPRVISVKVKTEKCLEWPDSVFSCATLESLKLFLMHPTDFHFVTPESIALPCLKTLELSGSQLGDNFMQQLFSGCPALESLTLDWCCNFSDISSNVLKNLTLNNGCLLYKILRISCPGLVSLSISSDYYNIGCISLENMVSLENADIKLVGYEQDDFDIPPNPKLVGGLSNATCLVLHLKYYPDLQVKIFSVP